MNSLETLALFVSSSVSLESMKYESGNQYDFGAYLYLFFTCISFSYNTTVHDNSILKRFSFKNEFNRSCVYCGITYQSLNSEIWRLDLPLRSVSATCGSANKSGIVSVQDLMKANYLTEDISMCKECVKNCSFCCNLLSDDSSLNDHICSKCRVKTVKETNELITL